MDISKFKNANLASEIPTFALSFVNKMLRKISARKAVTFSAQHLLSILLTNDKAHVGISLFTVAKFAFLNLDRP